MREILFRGKRIDNGEWVEGFLIIRNVFEGEQEKTFIAEKGHRYIACINKIPRVYEVDPSTVGQYTGLTDKNGKRIFEGDIFHLEEELIAVIIFKDGCFRLQVYGLCGTYTESGYDECGGGWGIVECEPIDWYYVHDMEVIGNIHDNPELLKR